jgi:Spy/CpxP family protein refolding chaperone
MNNIFLIVALLLVLGNPAFADSWGKGLGRGMGYGLGPCVDTELNLAPDQAAKVKAVQSQYLEAVRPLQRELRVKREELRVCEPGRVREEVRAAQLRREAKGIREKIREAWLRYKMDCRALLTPEQLDQLDSPKGSGMPRPGLGRMGFGEQ